jgi:ribonuclease HI
MYAMVGTRPDIAQAVSVVSQFLANPTKFHCDLVINIFKYLRSNFNCLHYKKTGTSIAVKGYVDASYNNEGQGRSRGGYAMFINDCCVSWNSHKQSATAAMSSAEAELMAAVEAGKELVWFIYLLEELGYKQQTCILMEDNQACIKLGTHPAIDHKRSKHIDPKWFWTRDHVNNGTFKFQYCPTKSQWADIFTKAVPGPQLREVLSNFMMFSSQGGNQNLTYQTPDR